MDLTEKAHNTAMKQYLIPLLKKALAQLQLDINLPAIHVERTRDSQHGDYACNIAMLLAKSMKKTPIQVAKQIVEHLPGSEWVEKVVIAGPGFINFFLTPQAFQSIIPTILKQGDQYGYSDIGKKKKIHLEFVSCNPTGPLHVGHGRSAAYGASLGNLLEVAGFDVHREFYVNDAGRQMDILATSLWLRYLELLEKPTFPYSNEYGYKGEYLKVIARELAEKYDNKFIVQGRDISLQPDRSIPFSDEDIDDYIRVAKGELGEQNFRLILDFVLKAILDDIREDLAEFGVEYNEWFSERTLKDDIFKALQKLEEGHYLYKDEKGATWFRSTDFGDDKDRVVVRDNGQPTYFASDIAYLLNKRERGFQDCILVLGADHHGYIARFKAAYQALGYDPKDLEIPMVQFAVLYRGKERVQMSTRSGSFVTLRELRNEVGNDACRFFYVMRKCEQHLDFDLELAKSRSNENPVYYIQYAHARICSVFRQFSEKWKSETLKQLVEPHEKILLADLAIYPELIEMAAVNREPHIIAHYLRELAGNFHAYYNAHGFLVDSVEVRDARLSLIRSVQQVLVNGLRLLGVSAPESM